MRLGEFYEIRTKKLANNQTAVLDLWGVECKKYGIIGVSLIVATKKRQVEDFRYGCLCESKEFMAETGKCGLEGLLWARDEIVAFEFPGTPNPKFPVYLCIGWMDEQRKRVYERGLLKYGFERRFIANCNVLAKQIA